MEEVNVFVAFIAGLATFFAPCTFTALPSFLGYISSYAFSDETAGKDKKKFDIRVLISTAFYLIGFLSVFTILGLTGTAFGSFLSKYSDFFETIGGGIILLLGLFMLFGDKLPSLSFLFRERKFDIKATKIPQTPFFPFAVGVTNAFAWTPCIGPILGAIILLASSTNSVFSDGAFLMFSYGVGVSLPFLILATILGFYPQITIKLGKFANILYKFNAILLIVIGIAFLLGLSDNLFGILYQFFARLGYQPK